ncbi:TetR/AcrR family transcriptional regulator [Patulibacter sp. SYSU D01012]|uniref:TetR/AcrR family transcriptional regulator n=1 Tax=Patulibacter sp. SYSU D01012 TaxID=2817381 RepID=UPI001FEF5146|nr:TetR/AcrR family transcriptional regulator [Patulibacter sp. SYSU D01012]
MSDRPPVPAPRRPSAGGDGGRPQRSDAVRNRRRVVEAATEVFGERGLDAPVPEIARRAGVGKGTVYRNFPTKEQLAAAVAVANLERYEAILRETLAAASAEDAVAALFGAAAEHLSRDRVLGQSVGAVADDPEVLGCQARIEELIAEALRRGQAAGVVRDDVTADDVKVVFIGIGRVLPPVGHGGRRELWDRMMLLALDALRPGGSALPRGFSGADESRETLRAARTTLR